MARKKVKKTCDECGEVFEAFPSNYIPRRGVLCSRDCIAVRRQKTHGVNCRQCRERFTPSDPKTTSGFCSHNCRKEHGRIARCRTCPTCGQEFESKNGTKYCSIKCGHASLKRVKLARCKWCDSVFERKMYRGPIHCSSDCRLAKSRLKRWVKARQVIYRKQISKSPKSIWIRKAKSELSKLRSRERQRLSKKTWREKCNSAMSTNRYRVSVRSWHRVSPTKGCVKWNQAAVRAMRVLATKFHADPWVKKCTSTASNHRQRKRRKLRRIALQN